MNTVKKKKTVYLWYVLFFAVLVAADQLLKAWVVGNIPLNASPAEELPLIPGLVHLSYIRNFGAAFGMMNGGRWLFLLLLAVFCGGVIWAVVTGKLSSPVQCWVAVAAVGGAVGNGIDRAIHGYVVDMFELEFMSFPVFNLADIFITVSCVLFVLLVLFEKPPKKLPDSQKGK